MTDPLDFDAMPAEEVCAWAMGNILGWAPHDFGDRGRHWWDPDEEEYRKAGWLLTTDGAHRVSERMSAEKFRLELNQTFRLGRWWANYALPDLRRWGSICNTEAEARLRAAAKAWDARARG